MSTVDLSAGDAWEDVVGQDPAVSLLRGASGAGAVHAWLFVGPRGSGKRAAAQAFAGDLLAHALDEQGDGAGAQRTRALARAEQHPDLIVVERVGPSITAEQAQQIVERASRSGIEGNRKVLVLDEFHLVQPAAAARLLKTIEEPTPGTFFVVLADNVPPELVTIASRCIRVDFVAVAPEVVIARLEAEGVDPARAAEAASFAGGDLDRARLLATDERLAMRLAAWRELPRRLDGSGATAAAAIADLRATIDDAQAPLKARHQAEVTELAERIERYGQRGSGAKVLEERHRREARRLRTDELRMGLGSLAASYRDELLAAADPTVALAGLAAVHDAVEHLLFNPSEELFLLDLALRLPSLNS
ncbi:MAG: holB [Acidimicrobiales bacterium]|nr:holB [Acidimicrobiales bacterium]